jgi:hypothetical protein
MPASSKVGDTQVGNELDDSCGGRDEEGLVGGETIALDKSRTADRMSAISKQILIWELCRFFAKRYETYK